MTNEIKIQIAKTFNTEIKNVSNIVIDEEDGNVTAKVNDINFTDCGYIEDYRISWSDNYRKGAM